MVDALVNFLDFVIRYKKLKNYSSLAKELGISHATVHRWIHGQDKPNARTCMKLADLADTPVAYILQLCYGGE